MLNLCLHLLLPLLHLYLLHPNLLHLWPQLPYCMVSAQCPLSLLLCCLPLLQLAHCHLVLHLLPESL